MQGFFPKFILFYQYHVPLHRTEQVQAEKIQVEDHRNIQELGGGQLLLRVITTAIIYFSLIAEKHFGMNGVSLIFEGTRRWTVINTASACE